VNKYCKGKVKKNLIRVKRISNLMHLISKSISFLDIIIRYLLHNEPVSL